MTVRTAELLMAILLGLASIGLMIKSAELNITWIPNRGPGAGAWPFWLSAGMLLCCLATLIRWFLGNTPESRNTKLFMTRETIRIVGVSAGALLFLLSATHSFFACSSGRCRYPCRKRSPSRGFTRYTT